MKLIYPRFVEICRELKKVEQIISDEIKREFRLYTSGLNAGCMVICFEKDLTKGQKKFVVDTLTKYVGELDRPKFFQVYNKVKEGRCNNFKFCTHFKQKR